MLIPVLLSHAALFCLVSGQSSFLAAAMLIAIVAWLDRKPVAAGVLIGRDLAPAGTGADRLRASPGRPRPDRRYYLSKAEAFHGPRLRPVLAGPAPPPICGSPSQYREHLIVWGFGLVRRQGPANLPQKEGYEDHGKGHWDRSRHHQFVRRRNGWEDSESHRKRRGHADDAVNCRLQRRW